MIDLRVYRKCNQTIKIGFKPEWKKKVVQKKRFENFFFFNFGLCSQLLIRLRITQQKYLYVQGVFHIPNCHSIHFSQKLNRSLPRIKLPAEKSMSLEWQCLHGHDLCYWDWIWSWLTLCALPRLHGVYISYLSINQTETKYCFGKL